MQRAKNNPLGKNKAEKLTLSDIKTYLNYSKEDSVRLVQEETDKPRDTQRNRNRPTHV